MAEGKILQDLAKYKHGTAFLSNIDGRGIVSVYSLVKRQDKKLRIVYDYVNILGYIGGELRDGFFTLNLRESEAVRLMKTHLDMALSRISLAVAPVEEVAALVIMPLYEKAKAKGMEFPNEDTRMSFEYYRNLARHCRFKSTREFIHSKLGPTFSQALASFDLKREEFDSWWMEKSELLYHECRLPPPIEIFSRFPCFGDSFECLMQFIQQSENERVESESWKKIAAEKFDNPVNRERLSGMAHQIGLWFLWKQDYVMAATMLKAWHEMVEDDKKGRSLDVDNPVVNHVLTMTQLKLSGMGECAGQTQVDWCIAKSDKCETCTTPAEEPEGPGEPSLLTCITKEGKAEFGGKDLRRSTVILLYAVEKFGMDKQLLLIGEHNLREACHVFLEHSFTTELYWRIKPTNPMTENVTKEASRAFLEELKADTVNITNWAESCVEILRLKISQLCSSKLEDKDAKKLSRLFKTALGKVVIEYEELKSNKKFTEKYQRVDSITALLMFDTVLPFWGNQFQWLWRVTAEGKRRKFLTLGKEKVTDACKQMYETYVQIEKGEGVRRNGATCGNADCDGCLECVQHAQTVNCILGVQTFVDSRFVTQQEAAQLGDFAVNDQKSVDESSEPGQLLQASSLDKDAISLDMESDQRGQEDLQIAGNTSDGKLSNTVTECDTGAPVDDRAEVDERQAEQESPGVSEVIVPSLKEEVVVNSTKGTEEKPLEHGPVAVACSSAEARESLGSELKGKENLLENEEIPGKDSEAQEDPLAESDESESGRPPRCSTPESCACQDFQTFLEHLLKVLSGENRPLWFLQVQKNGDIALCDDFLDADGELVKDVISFEDDYIPQEIADTDSEELGDCMRLSIMCKVACHKMYVLLKMKLAHAFEDLRKLENERSTMHTCGGCQTVETRMGTFKKCSQCKEVYYCSRRCQAKDWKAGHKQKCQQGSQKQ